MIDRCRDLLESKGRMREPERLRALLDLNWRWLMEEHPEFATYVGYASGQDRWSDVSLEAIERRKGEVRAQAEVAGSIDRSALGAEDALNHDLFLRQVERDVEGQRFKGEYLAISSQGGVWGRVPDLLRMMPAGTRAQAEAVLARLERAPALVDQTIALLEEGLAQGVTQPQITLAGVDEQIALVAEGDPGAGPFVEPFARAPADVAPLRERAAAIVGEKVLPAFRRLHGFVAERYVPASRETIACRDLPDGEAWYAYLVRRYTTLDRTPEEIHEIGISEVARIRKEMDQVIAEAGFTGSFEAFAEFLRTDPGFFFDDADALLAAYRDISKRVDPELARLFGRLSRLPYGVVAVPPYLERKATTAYYQPGSPEAGRAGYFYANTYDLAARPRWEMEALTLHEAVPGHHLQIAIAQELEGVPDFRKHGGFTAFIEGWGLYAESLGGDMGFYRDPYSRFGQLTYEIWRAIRLVVDTGIHALGWTRERATDFFRSNAPKAEHDIVVEVDRYISWPGQALAYKMGELAIKDLRARAEAALGERFDVRAFHDAVLEAGALPLDVLEARIAGWIARAAR